MNELDQKVYKAKVLMLKKSHFAFISSILYKLDYKPSPSTPTMCYDGLKKCIYLNEPWFLGLSDQEACSALAHEALHYALQHDIRMGVRDPELYNRAADHVVNNILMDCGFELPEDVPVDRRFQNKSTEYVYKFMEHEEQNQNNQDQDPDPSPFGNDIISNVLLASHQAERNADTIVANQLDGQGNGSGIGDSQEAFKELFTNITESSRNWTDILIEYMNAVSQGDRSWKELDRRMLALNYYLPNTKEDNRIERIAIAIDVSGSVYPHQIKYFLKEIKSIKNNLNPEILDIVSFNTKITGKWSFTQDQNFTDIEMDIDGGTSLTPVWNHFNKPENKPNFLIVFSDMEVNIPDKPDYDVIWGIVDNPNMKIPYGKHIHIGKADYDK